jgi:antitoxin (DNA-binding transcriptional repressor) of toxin-antitoxin stability system
MGSSVKTVSVLEFRQHAERIIRQVQKGQRFVLTYRHKPVMRLEPVLADAADDPIYALADLAAPRGQSLTNAEIDGAVYGS